MFINLSSNKFLKILSLPIFLYLTFFEITIPSKEIKANNKLQPATEQDLYLYKGMGASYLCIASEAGIEFPQALGVATATYVQVVEGKHGGAVKELGDDKLEREKLFAGAEFQIVTTAIQYCPDSVPKDAEIEEKRYQEALDKARNEVDGANEKQKVKLLSQIKELEERMKEMEEKKRTISQAEITKTGHVYVISNVGSFGDGVYKIGMTRRLEPLDRVKELGDASVPFPFDIHAMIRTTNAPGLENALHKHFDNKRVNLENTRKEFFFVSIEEIKDELIKLKSELGIDSDFQLTMLAEAKQYWQSEAKRKHLENLYNQS